MSKFIAVLVLIVAVGVGIFIEVPTSEAKPHDGGMCQLIRC